MAELRYNRLFSEWTLYAPERRDAQKPHTSGKVVVPEGVDCPFDNDSFFDKDRVVDSYPSIENWRALIVPNAFGGINSNIPLKILSDEYFFKTMNGYGVDDLIVLSEHNKKLFEYSVEELFYIWGMIIDRIIEMDSSSSIVSFTLLQQQGLFGGASINHPHLHLIFSPMIQKDLSEVIRSSEAYAHQEDKSLLASYISSELSYGDRILFKDQFAVSLVQYAGMYIADTIIAPLHPIAHMHKTSDEVMVSILRALGATLKALDRAFDSPDYVLRVYSAPLRNGALYPYMHWFIRITPRFGVESYSSGSPSVSMFPEVAASHLRKYL